MSFFRIKPDEVSIDDGSRSRLHQEVALLMGWDSLFWGEDPETNQPVLMGRPPSGSLYTTAPDWLGDLAAAFELWERLTVERICLLQQGPGKEVKVLLGYPPDTDSFFTITQSYQAVFFCPREGVRNPVSLVIATAFAWAMRRDLGKKRSPNR